MTRREKAYVILEILVTVMVPVVWLSMALQAGFDGFLSSRGVQSLKYFTVLSNLLAGLASFTALLGFVSRKKGADRRLPKAILIFRYVATVSVLTTFLTVLVFFLPLYGYAKLYAGSNFWFHMIIPLTSIAGFFAIPDRTRISFKATFLTLVPVLLYAAFYCANLLINGVGGAYPHTNDWYGFLNWGWTIGWCIFAGIAAATWLAGFILRTLFNISRGKKESEPDNK